jgi:hypothetical protein
LVIAGLIAAVLGAIAASASLWYLVRNGRPHPAAFLQRDPSSGNIGAEPADVFSLSVANNGASPLRVTVRLELDGEPVGVSLDGPVSTQTVTIAVSQRQGWSLAVERRLLDGADDSALKARVSYRWLLRQRSLVVGRGERGSV